MAKTQEELNELKNEYETLNNKLKELTDDELTQVTGGLKREGSTYTAVGGCEVTNQIRESNNKCSQRFVCSFMDVECQYR